MEINIKPIGFIRNTRKEIQDDYWGGVISEIIIEARFDGEAMQGIEDFSHAEIIFYFDQVDESKIMNARHPRNNPDWPKVGIFAQRGTNRPNRLGLTTVKIIKCEKNVIFVVGLDAVDGTPVLDIKPVMREFLPDNPIHQPQWATELMAHYWDKKKS